MKNAMGRFITALARFDNNQRRATADTDKILGLNALWIINELRIAGTANGADK